VITFKVLCGYEPFRADTDEEMIFTVNRGKLRFHDQYWKKVSPMGM
jgi:calcium/calmodulin-dependent protein kinase I